jgi:ribosomal protein S18 acetylase RimI-like enzyme
MNSATSIVIRRAGQSDLETVREISAEAYIPAYMAVIGAIPKPAVENYSPYIARGEVWLLDADNTPAGLIVLVGSSDHLLVYSIAVRPAQQRQGYARKLLRFAEQRASAGGIRELRLYTNMRMERNLALYRRCGFVEIGTRPHPSRAGETLVDMVKQVDLRPENSETRSG